MFKKNIIKIDLLCKKGNRVNYKTKDKYFKPI